MYTKNGQFRILGRFGTFSHSDGISDIVMVIRIVINALTWFWGEMVKIPVIFVT